jgi:hypothetical protein
MKILAFSLLTMMLMASANAQETKIDLASFKEVKGYDQLNITLEKSSKNQAVVSGDHQSEVKIVNDKGLLKIRMELDNILKGKNTSVTLYHTEDLVLVDANEGANMDSKEALMASTLALRAQEGGKIKLKVQSRNLSSKAVTGGIIEVSGSATEQEVTVRTGGEYLGKNLKTEQTDVTVFAGGKAAISASEYVEANVTAGGSIEVFGNPKQIERNETFGGSIKKM